MGSRMATGPVAQPKSDELLNRVERLGRAVVLDELELRRIAAEARKLMDVDAAGANAVLGTLAAVDGDLAETKRRYGIVLNLDRGVTSWFNYSMSLALLDEHEESFDVAQEGAAMYPDNLLLLRRAVDSGVESANFVAAEKFCQQWEKMVPDKPSRMRVRVAELAKAVREGLMTEGGARAMIEVLTAIQREEGIRSVSAEVMGGEEGFLYDRTLRCTPQKASEMNWRVAGEVVERTDLSCDPGRTFSVAFIGAADVGNS